jgi:hypothetical protein
VEHRVVAAPLPDDMMCLCKYALRLQYLKKRIKMVDGERNALKRQWEEYKMLHEAAEAMLSNNEEGPSMAREPPLVFSHRSPTRLRS